MYPRSCCFCSVALSCSTLCDPMGCSNASLPCLSLSLGVYSNSRPSSRWCHPTISFSVIPFSSCSQTFPALGSFPMSWLLASGGQSTGASALASVLPMCIQGWFSLGLPGLIFLQSKGLLKVLQFESISSLVLSFLYSPILTSIHDYWKNYSFDYMDLCWQSNVSAF